MSILEDFYTGTNVSFTTTLTINDEPVDVRNDDVRLILTQRGWWGRSAKGQADALLQTNEIDGDVTSGEAGEVAFLFYADPALYPPDFWRYEIIWTRNGSEYVALSGTVQIKPRLIYAD